uniref:EF-hand domain-containing protein n=1 Tax=Molossus molossus TaxID=27622 RepID=A0A7J8CRR3_MOLMO|nr:hypothetical protein HJG59_009760 [Molossus molossus]
MPKLLQSVVTMIEIFYQYATQDEECHMLNKAKLKKFLENEFHPIMKKPDGPDTVDTIMQILDRDHNEKVDFNEYLLMIFQLAQACNKVIGKDYCQASGSKQRDHNHQHQEEHSETEEKNNGQESSSSNLRWSAGSNESYSRGFRGSIKHRPQSSSRRMGHQEGLSSLQHRQSSGERWRESSSGHFKDNKKNKHGSHQQEGSRSEEVGYTHLSNSIERSHSANQSSDCEEQGHVCHSEDQSFSSDHHLSDSNESLRNRQYKSKSSQHHGFSSGSCGGQEHWSNYDPTDCGCESGSGQSSQQRWHESNAGSQSGNCEEQGYCSSSSGVTNYEKHGSSSGQSSSQRKHGFNSSGQSGSYKRQKHGSGSGQSSNYGKYGSGSNQSSSQRYHESSSESSLAMDNMVLLQDSHQALDIMELAQVSLLAVANMGQDQASLPAMKNMGLNLVNPLAMANTGLAQVNLLAIVIMGLDQVNPLVMDNTVLLQDSHQVIMELAQVSLPALVNTGLAQVNLLAMANMGQE